MISRLKKRNRLSDCLAMIIILLVVSSSVSYGRKDSIPNPEPVKTELKEVTKTEVKTEVKAEPILVDGIMGIVGGSIILKSDVDIQIKQLKEQGITEKNNFCFVWKELLFQKLLIHNAEVDSVIISEKEVDREINRRLKYLLGQMKGSEVEFQKYFGKTVLQFKDEMRPLISESLQAKRMQATISQEVDISPSEVVEYYNSIPKDSLPIIEEQYKVAQIILTPKASSFEKKRIKKQLEAIREDIIKGKDFGLMALLHSQDPGSRTKKGELGFTNRDQLVPAFSNAAFKLKPNEISEIIESPYGYHLIQMIQKKGSFINVRHILLTFNVYTTDIEATKIRMDSILTAVAKDSTSFNKIATELSDDPRTKENGGVLLNYPTGDDYFAANQLEENLFFTVQKLKKGEVCAPELIQLPGGKNGYRVVKLVDQVHFHTASIEEDYSMIKKAALERKRQNAVDKWIMEKVKDTYVKLPAACNACPSLGKWVQQSKL